MRHYKARSIDRPNAFRAYSFEDLKIIYESRAAGQNLNEIADTLGRSVSSIINIVSYLKGLLKFPTWKDATARLATSRLSDKSIKAYHQLYEYIKGNSQVPSSNGEVNSKSLEGAIEEVDKLFEQLKTKISNLVEVAVKEGTAQFKNEMETELISLRTVVESAKQNNLAAMLKKRLLGG